MPTPTPLAAAPTTLMLLSLLCDEVTPVMGPSFEEVEEEVTLSSSAREPESPDEKLALNKRFRECFAFKNSATKPLLVDRWF